MIALSNPYCSLAEVQAEVRNSEVSAEDALRNGINQASRWIEKYLMRDYAFHDHSVTPLLIRACEGAVHDHELFLPYDPIVTLTEVREMGVLLTEDVHFVRRREFDGRQFALIRLGVGSAWSDATRPGWVLGDANADALSFLGTFGYFQPWKLSGVAINAPGAGYAASDALTLTGTSGTAPTLLVGNVDGSGAILTATISNGGALTTRPSGSYGVSGGSGSNATFTVTGVETDRTVVPSGLPGDITLAAIHLAGAFSGWSRRDVVGLDGSKTSVESRDIPKMVYELLGAMRPII